MSNHLLPSLISGPRRIASLLLISLLSAMMAGAPATALAASTNVVIAEVYESGGKTGASYHRDYAVLKNISGSSVDLNGWSFQHYKTTLGWKVLNLTNSIAAGGYYLIRCHYDGGSTTGIPALPTPDVTSPAASDWNLSSGTPEAIAIVNNTATLTSCTDASIVDLVGYGTTPPCSEGTSTSFTTITQSTQRASSGCQDWDNNSVDFALGTPNPRNTASSVGSCSLPPIILLPPQSQTVETGSNVTFSVTASGTPPLSYQWFLEGTNAIANATNTTLYLANVATNDAGGYSVTVTNAYGSTNSVTATLTVNPPAPPGIVDDPASQSVLEGTNVTFTVTAAGSLPLSYQWGKDGTPILDATNGTYSIGSVTTNDAGGYDVIVNNAYGSATSAVATLQVTLNTAPPTISSQPLSQTAQPGANVSFSVTASGANPLSYQWRKDGAGISAGSNPSATNTILNLSTLSTNDQGGYDVLVTNAYGSVTSVVATLTVSTNAPLVNPNDFINMRFSNVTVTSGIQFATATNFYGTVKNLLLDVYQPTGDPSSNRPVIVWIHGGGFRSDSSRTQGYIVTYATDFAKRGYVCMSIDYRLRNGGDMPTQEYELPAEQDASHDANTALAWIRTNATQYGVNTNWMFVAGGSAGGRIGCVLSYHEGPDTNLCSCYSAPTNGVPNNAVPYTDWNRSGVIALGDLWGSPEPVMRWYTLDSQDVPTCIVHGTADTTIPYTNSVELYDGLVAAGVTVELHPLVGYGHTPTGASTNPQIESWLANFFAQEWNKVLAPPTEAPTAGFTATPTNGVEPLNVSFTDASINSPTGWSWDFGDAGTSTLQNPSHSYTTAGVYTVSLIASNGGGSTTNTKTAYISVITAAQSWQNHYGVAPDTSDPLGKGINNANQFLAGFDPTDAAAYPHVISVQTVSAGVNITYLGASGDNTYAGGPQFRTNLLEYTAGSGGSYSNNFSSTGVSEVLSNGNGSGSASTMTDLGGATNVPSRYYRVRVLVP